jgi:predicted nucleotidyltransferase
MSGHITQRGDMAAFSKWARVRMALSCGADAVFELPTLFAVRTADAFARGGVGVLGGLGVDLLSFGCETTDLRLIGRMAELRDDEPTEVSDAMRQRLSRGMSHARARGETLAEYLGVPVELLNRPNLILASEYVRAVRKHFPHMACCPIQRIGDYHDDAMGEYASASAIRHSFAEGNAQSALNAIPPAARPYAQPDALHPLDDLLLYRLRSMSMSELATLPDMGEGLEHRLFRLCRQTSTRETLMNALKCKRYTYARLNRLLTHVLLGVTQADLDAFPMPTYARLLGIRGGTEPLLRELRQRATLPIAASSRTIERDAVFQWECRATDLWALAHDYPEERLPARELTERFVRV